jgi:ABC-type bacteriocin/lantibiotic exporter with double-glycine peptidase domain
LTDESIFEGTILENLTFGDTSISSEEIMEVLINTGLNDFVKKQPIGLKTMLYPEGKQLSYTISKKIILARSIIRKPKLLILKDPLDHFEEIEGVRIMNYLTNNSRDWSLVIVSQNSKWKTKCNKFITLEDGKILS